MSTARGRQQPRKPRTSPVAAPRRPVAPAAPPLLHQPTAWARERIVAGRAAGDVPDYGSPEWEALADADPRKLAAALVYAEVTRMQELTVVERLQAEIAEGRYAAECEAWQDEIEAGAREAMARAEATEAACRRLGEHGVAQLMGRRPTMRQLAVRRGDVAAVARADRQAERLAGVPPIEQLMRRPAAG